MIPGQRQYSTGWESVYCSYARNVVLGVSINFVCFAVGIDDIIGDYKGQSLYLDVHFFIGVFCFIQAYTKLEMAFSSTSYLDFLDAKESLVIIFFLEESIESLDDFRCNTDLEHACLLVDCSTLGLLVMSERLREYSGINPQSLPEGKDKSLERVWFNCILYA